MKVKKISAANVEACSLPRLFDEEKIDFQPVQCVNWAEYPYKPKVNFRIAHTKNSILLHFKVKEASVRARYGTDNGSVWTDSCVEFFSIPAGDGVYYNIECNCSSPLLRKSIVFFLFLRLLRCFSSPGSLRIPMDSVYGT